MKNRLKILSLFVLISSLATLLVARDVNLEASLKSQLERTVRTTFIESDARNKTFKNSIELYNSLKAGTSGEQKSPALERAHNALITKVAEIKRNADYCRVESGRTIVDEGQFKQGIRPELDNISRVFKRALEEWSRRRSRSSFNRGYDRYDNPFGYNSFWGNRGYNGYNRSSYGSSEQDKRKRELDKILNEVFDDFAIKKSSYVRRSLLRDLRSKNSELEKLMKEYENIGRKYAQEKMSFGFSSSEWNDYVEELFEKISEEIWGAMSQLSDPDLNKYRSSYDKKSLSRDKSENYLIRYANAARRKQVQAARDKKRAKERVNREIVRATPEKILYDPYDFFDKVDREKSLSQKEKVEYLKKLLRKINDPRVKRDKRRYDSYDVEYALECFKEEIERKESELEEAAVRDETVYKMSRDDVENKSYADFILAETEDEKKKVVGSNYKMIRSVSRLEDWWSFEGGSELWKSYEQAYENGDVKKAREYYLKACTKVRDLARFPRNGKGLGRAAVLLERLV